MATLPPVATLPPEATVPVEVLSWEVVPPVDDPPGVSEEQAQSNAVLANVVTSTGKRTTVLRGLRREDLFT